MGKKIYLRPVKEDDMPIILQWWNDIDNFGATGFNQTMSMEDALKKFHLRLTSHPYEDWFAICCENKTEPIGIIIIAPHHPKENLISIDSIIIDKQSRRKGIGYQAIKEVEKWIGINYPGLTLSLGVFDSFPNAKAFWMKCGYIPVETVDTNFFYRGIKQIALKFNKKLENGTIITEY